jgi:MFS family permease
LSALGVAPFRRLVAAWTFSNFGDSVLYLTLAIWVKDLTGSDAAAGLVFLFLGLPVFLAPFAGQLADRYSRKRLVIFANLISAGGVLGLGLVGDASDLWIIYAITFLYGLLTYVTSSAGAGLVRDMLTDDQLASGNGILQTIDQGLRLLSPLVGAGAYVVFGGFAVALVTTVMLICAAAVMATVRVTETAHAEERQPFWPEVTAGLRHIRSVPVLSRVTIAMSVAFGVTGLANTAIFAVIEQGLDRGSEFFGVIASVQGGGSVVGGVTAAAVVGRLGERRAVALGLALLGVGMGVAVVPNVGVVVVGSVVIGLSIPWFVVAFATLRQRLTPNQLQGRVAAAASIALTGPQTVGTAVGAVLITVVDYRVMLVGMAVTVAVCAIPIADRRRGAPAVQAEAS